MTTDAPEIVEGELLPAVIETPPAPLTLFGTSDPKVALERMSDVAGVLVDVIKDRKLFVRISGHEHITAEGWTTLGGMLGIVPVVVWTRPNETEDGYVARVEARTLDGRVVGAAESECSRAERKWKSAEPYAIRSMAQTRAIGRALRAPLGQIVVLAGYSPSGAEEVVIAEAVETPVIDAAPTREQVDEIGSLVRSLEQAAPNTDWLGYCREIISVPKEQMTRGVAAGLIRQLQAQLAELLRDPDEAA